MYDYRVAPAERKLLWDTTPPDFSMYSKGMLLIGTSFRSRDLRGFHSWNVSVFTHDNQKHKDKVSWCHSDIF